MSYWVNKVAAVAGGEAFYIAFQSIVSQIFQIVPEIESKIYIKSLLYSCLALVISYYPFVQFLIPQLCFYAFPIPYFMHFPGYFFIGDLCTLSVCKDL